MLAFCDRIAHDIAKALRGGWLSEVSQPMMDLHPTEGWMQSTKKTIMVKDGKKEYKITIEEV